MSKQQEKSTTSIFQEGADFWYYEVGVNTIPADTKNKTTYERWTRWQDNPIPEELFSQWKNEGKFVNGLAVILGKIWRGPYKDKYLIGIDYDNQKAIDENCASLKVKDIDELSNWTIVEQHNDQPDKAHIYVLSTKPFKKKSSDKVNKAIGQEIDTNNIPAIEVKGSGEHGILFCWPSIHKNGRPYKIIGTKKPALCDSFEGHLDKIFQKYGIPYLDKRNEKNTDETNSDLIPIQEIFESDFVIQQGHNRHQELLRAMESLIKRNKEILDLSSIKKLGYEWNQQHCSPPLDDTEFERQWMAASDFIIKKERENKTVVNNNNGNYGNDKQGDTLESEISLELVEKHIVELFVDQYQEPYAALYIDDHTEILSLKSRRFKNFIYKIVHEDTGKINNDKIDGIINILKSKAEFSKNIKNLDLRIAKTDDYTFYYDLTNQINSIVKITPDGWSVIKDTPILFKKYRNHKEQVIPVSVNSRVDDKDDIFDKFIDLLNITDKNNKLLLKSYIVSLFIPDIAKPILILTGEQGSAKSTFQELIKMLVDPSILRTITFPREINELIQTLSHNYVAYFDNISTLPGWISDVLCRAVTGSGFTKRQLFSDDDDFIYTFKRCTGINGINLEATKADLLDRGIIIQLERIPKDKRKKLDNIWQEFDRLTPQVLGYIFDILVKILKFKKSGQSLELKELPRMADFAEYGEIIARCMGYQDNEFLQAYCENIDIQIDEAIHASPLSMAVITFMDTIEAIWTGTATDLKEKLDEVAVNNLKINIEKTPSSSWPKAANKLTHRLNEIKTNLREKGIVIDKFKDQGKRMIKISKVSSISSNRPILENQIQLPESIMDDTVDNETI